MANWRRIIVGDAFRPSSRDFNYYRDLALLWPFLLFSIIAFSEFYDRTTTRGHRVAMLAIAIGCLVLAKEKLMLFAVALAFVALRCVWAFATGIRGLNLLITFAVTGGLASLLVLARRNRRMSYEYPEKTGTLDVVVGLVSLAGAIALKIWMDKLFA